MPGQRIFGDEDVELHFRDVCGRVGLDPDVPLDEQGEAFARFLAGFVAERDAFLVLSDLGLRRYVQFAVLERDLLCETVSNRFLAGEDRLTADDEELLRAYGWREPGESEGSPNWSLQLPVPAPIGRLTILATRALTDIVGARCPSELFLTFFRGRLLPTETATPLMASGRPSSLSSGPARFPNTSSEKP